MGSRSIRLENLTKRYGATVAVNAVNLDVRPGEFLSLLGPSGCGKTTILRMIAGFVAPSAGRIFVDASEITHVAPNRRNIGLVFQNYALWPHMTVFENVAFGLRLRGLSAPQIETKVKGALDLTNLAGLGGRYPRELSGGQQQRVALARSLALDPPVLLMDEPLSNLDRKLRVTMRRELKLLQSRLGMTTLYVTHDQEEALSMSDRVAVMNEGRLIRVATPKEIYDDPRSDFVADFVGSTNIFAGRVAAVRDGRAIVRTEYGVELAVNHAADVREGAPARLLVRPECVELVDATAAGVNVLEGRVALAEYFGPTERITLTLPSGASVTAEGPNLLARAQIGAPARIRIDPETIRILKPDAPA